MLNTQPFVNFIADYFYLFENPLLVKSKIKHLVFVLGKAEVFISLV